MTDMKSPSRSSSQATEPGHDWRARCQTYGSDSRVLQDIMRSHNTETLAVDTVEMNLHERTGSVSRNNFTDINTLEEFLDQTRSADEPSLRTLNVRCLSKSLIKVLGAYFNMEYDLWTSRKVACDREYFAAPLNEKGATKFFHFHLACVNFYLTTDKTPPMWRTSRKIDHTTRLFMLVGSNSQSQRISGEGEKVMLIQRVTGHLRLDESRWTFLYLCDPIDNFEQAHYELDHDFDSLSNSGQWLSECVADGTSDVHAQDLCRDGFGLLAKIFRDIKSSWKLLLTRCENWLEEANENFSDQDFIDAANFLHREYLLNLDYFQRQLFYHERCVMYLSSSATRGDMNILPTVFIQDFFQEINALKVLGLRLNALRQRTTNVLDMILSLNSIRQTEIQRQDAKTALRQGESLRKLTLINMAFLPPSFAAAVFGMNTPQTDGLQIWIFVLTASILCVLTVASVMLAPARRLPTLQKDSDPAALRPVRDTPTAPLPESPESVAQIKFYPEDPELGGGHEY